MGTGFNAGAGMSPGAVSFATTAAAARGYIMQGVDAQGAFASPLPALSPPVSPALHDAIPVRTMDPITTWESAHARNVSLLSSFALQSLPRSILEEREGVTGFLMASRGWVLPAQRKACIQPFVDFIAGERARRHEPEGREGWASVAKLRSPHERHYLPRDAHPYFAFDPSFASLFGGVRVLDVGCRNFNDVPFFERYRRMGAEALGVDINARTDLAKGVHQGDVRMLPFEDASFDFISVPKIFGCECPSNTLLEIVVGLSELHRVLANGMVHIADHYIAPELAYVAQAVGFRVFTSPLWTAEWRPWDGVPVGYLLAKQDAALDDNPFKTILDRLAAGELVFSASGTDRIAPTSGKPMPPSLLEFGANQRFVRMVHKNLLAMLQDDERVFELAGTIQQGLLDCVFSYPGVPGSIAVEGVDLVRLYFGAPKEVRLVMFLHDMGFTSANVGGFLSARGYAKAHKQRIKALLSALEMTSMQTLESDVAVRSILSTLQKEGGDFPADYLKLIAASYDVTPQMEARLAAAARAPLAVRDLAVKGSDLAAEGLKGKAIGRALSRLLGRVIEDPSLNTREQLLEIVTAKHGANKPE